MSEVTLVRRLGWDGGDFIEVRIRGNSVEVQFNNEHYEAAATFDMTRDEWRLLIGTAGSESQEPTYRT
jgi:hypothetical protein